jgi:ACR3 family arsenite efflux pump ArsB
MERVDWDFDKNGYGRHFWNIAFTLVAVGAFALLVGFWDKVFLLALPFSTFARFVLIPFMFIFPLIVSLATRRYIRTALKENLVSERVANNCEYFTGIQLLVVYFLIMLFAVTY